MQLEVKLKQQVQFQDRPHVLSISHSMMVPLAKAAQLINSITMMVRCVKFVTQELYLVLTCIPALNTNLMPIRPILRLLQTSFTMELLSASTCNNIRIIFSSIPI
jgi:hypothetical protein